MSNMIPQAPDNNQGPWANLENYLRTLKEIGYAGPLTIEREIPQEPDRQKAEISHAIRLLSQLKAKIG